MSSSKEKISRRTFVTSAGGLATGLGIASLGWYRSSESESDSAKKIVSLESLAQQRLESLNQAQSNLATVQQRLDQLSQKWVTYGSGSNLKFMPDPVSGQATVPLEEIWGFDNDFAFCRVQNNPQAFSMTTNKMGKITVDANTFYMLMLSTLSRVTSVTQTPGGAQVLMNGSLHCSTEAGVAGVKVGGRTTSEPADFEIVAISDKQGDSFAFTVFFSPTTAPINNAIFGDKFIFTGKLTTGGVVARRAVDL